MSNDSDYSDLQQPSSNYGSATAVSNGYGPSKNATSPYRRSPVRVAERDAVAQKKKPAPPKKKKEPRKKKPEWKAIEEGPHQATSSIHILFYFKHIYPSYPFEKFLQRLHGSATEDAWPSTSKFIANNIQIIAHRDSDTAWSDLGAALHDPGAIVVYWGHSERAKSAKSARNLRPHPDSANSSVDIKISELKTILPTINAKVFILAACATDGCIGTVSRDTAIVSTDSGKDTLTRGAVWAKALEAFLMKFVDGGTISECVGAANPIFAADQTDSDDKFILTSGKGDMTWIK
jgi:hypothetical protein